MKVRGTEIITVEGLAEIDSIANEVSHTEWREYSPSADTLKRGIDVARTAVISLREAKTVEEWIAGRRIAKRAIDELLKAKLQADVIELRARRAAISGIGAVAAVANFFEHADYKGRHLALGPGYLKDMSKNIVEGKDFNDVISSHKILPDHIVTAYEDINFGGASVNLTGNVPDYSKDPVLKNWNDVISSMRINGPVVTPTIPVFGKGLWDKITDTCKMVATNTVDATKATIEVIRDAFNKMALKIAEMTGQAQKVKAQRAAALASVQELRALAPRVKDPKIREDITRFEIDIAKLDAQTAPKLGEVNKTTENANQKASEAKRGEIEGIGFVGVDDAVIIAVAAGAIIIALVVLLTSWRKTEANAKALVERAKADAELADAEKERLGVVDKQIDASTSEKDRLLSGADEDRNLATEAFEAGDVDAANAHLRDAQAKDAQAAKLMEFITQPIEPLKLPSAVPAEAKPPGEKTALEKWTGIKPQWIGMGAVAIVAIMLLPHIIPLVKGAIPKPKKE